ncbi:MAG: DUF349 domain-containing protein [Bacteroidetes bacterium]|nr:DUF349 domain-containing protein [Bacteroidota bacterium]
METKDQHHQTPDEPMNAPDENSTEEKEAMETSPKPVKEKPKKKPSPKTKEPAKKNEMAESSDKPGLEGAEQETEEKKDKPEEEISSKQVKSEEKPVEKDKTTTAEVEPEKSLEVEEESKVEPVKEEVKTLAETTSEESMDAPGDDHEDEEDEEEDDHEEEHEEEVIDYDTLSREELVDLLEEIVNTSEVNTIKKKVALIKVAFLKLNKEEQEKRLEEQLSEDDDKDDVELAKDEVEIRFNAAFDIYKEKRAAWLARQEEIKQENLDKKKLILEELKALIESEESLKKTYDEFRNLQDKWKAVGMVPKNEANNLWQNYHFFVERFFDKVKINKELRDLDMKKNLESKIELCEKAEELILENSVIKSFKQLQLLHHQWKDIGPVPDDKKDELWDRFKNATDQINQRRRDHYNELKEEQTKNLAAKTVLCEKAEEVLAVENETVKDWQENTQKISDLLKVWKTVGPAPRAQNDEIWERFKTSLDTFFAGKKEFFKNIKEEQLNNYNLKLDLCAQAESIKDSSDWKQATNELINLQKEWKQIGPVPRKHSDKVWKRFRAACDEFFNRKSEYFSNIKQHEADNLKLKEELIQKVAGHEFGKDKDANLETIKEFQREWMEIGHVPFKEKDRVQNAFRDAINKQFDKLKINRAEMQTMNFKQRFEGVKDKPNANRIINNELNFLHGKRKQLEDDVKLWENNIGFLASSKKADLLKQEFENKIDKVKEEIKVITEKIKFLERETE